MRSTWCKHPRVLSPPPAMGAGFILPVERISTTNTSYVLDGYILFNNFCHVANSDFYKLIFNHVVTSLVYYIDVLV